MWQHPAAPAPTGNFVHYLPQDEAVAAGLGAEEGGLDPVESQRAVDLLKRELSRLLKLNAREFWREVFLQEKKLLDLPKLLDICAIYGDENEDLTRLQVGNALKAQPGLHDSLNRVLFHFLSIVHTMHLRCSSSLEALFFSESHEDPGSRWLHADLLELWK